MALPRKEVDDLVETLIGRGPGSRLSEVGTGDATPPYASRPSSPAVSGLPLPPVLGRSSLGGSGSRASDGGSEGPAVDL